MTSPLRSAYMLAIVGVKLSTLPRRVVFIGGATTELFITDPAAAAVRSTIDVDVIVDVESRVEYMTTLRDELLEVGARVDTSDDAPTCRWILDGVRIDVMRSREDVLGFTNRWYQATLEQAREHPLRDGTVVLVATGPLFLATRIEAFRGRGAGDYFASKDMEDIMTLLDGRPEIVEEVAAAEPGLRTFVRDAFAEWLKRRDFADVIAGHLLDPGGEERADVVFERMTSIVQGA